MTGSLAEKNGKYYAVLNLNEHGKRKQKWINTGLPIKGNKKKADQFLRIKLAEYERLEGIVRTDTLLSDYIRIWMEQIARTVDATTLQCYQIVADKHVLPYFDAKKKPLSEVDHHILQEYIDIKHHSGRRDGKGGLSSKTLRQHKNILTQALDMAVKNKLLPTNPCQFIILPSLERFESNYYNATQLKALFSALQDDPFLPLVKITVIYGLRRSELLGIQWKSVDFDNRTVTIRHTVSRVSKTVAKDKTKNASSHRTFPLTDESMEIFKELKQQEEYYRCAFGSEYLENDYVFKWPDGHTYAPEYISTRFRKLLKKHNLPHIRFHELRHSCASMLLAMGWTLKDVQEWLGHSDIQMTANIYSHLEFGRKAEIAASLSEKLQT